MPDTKHLYSVWITEHYEVTNDGRVFSHKTGTPYELKQEEFAGYKKIGITYNGKLQNWRIHRLVATCFHGLPPTDKHVARHLDGTRNNNHYTNIAWGTQKENRADDKLTGAQQRATDKMREHAKRIWTPARKQQQAKVIANVWTTDERRANAKATWLNATPETKAKTIENLKLGRQSPNWRPAASAAVTQSNSTRWESWTPEQRQRAIAGLEKARQAQAQKRLVAKATEIQKINQGRTRPYLDAGHNTGPQLDLFNNFEDDKAP